MKKKLNQYSKHSIDLYIFFAWGVILFLVLGCSKGGKSTPNPTPIVSVPTPTWDPNAIRGAWITTAASTALDSKDNIKAMVGTCKSNNINHIFVVVYNNGRTIYPSAVMQSTIGIRQLERYVGRDPLKECIDEAKLVGIKVHAWFEYGFSSSYSANGGAIIAAKPNWAARDQSNQLVVKNGFDWLNGIHPEVQQYMINLFKEVVTDYQVDGVQGDDRLPAMPSSGGYDEYTTTLYKSENNGANPPSNISDAGWIRWRANKLNAFVKRLRNEVKAIKANVLLTMSPSPYPFSINEYLQDWPTWVDSSWIDMVMPQCYRYTINDYEAVLTQQKSYYKNVSVQFYPGVLVKSGNTIQSDGLMSQFIQSNRNNGFKGEVFFFYEGVKDKTSWFQGLYPFIK